MRVANWRREIRTESLSHIREDTGRIPTLPGVYIFRDQSGYLYVGESANLRKRLTEHMRSSDRPALADYLAAKADGSGVKDGKPAVTVEMHVFPSDSPAAKTQMRRAYESSLIASRRPRFNVRP